MVNETADEEASPSVANLAPSPPSPSIGTTPVEHLLHFAIEQRVPVETMEKLLDMHRRLKEDAAREHFNAAVSAFQAECPAIFKGRTAGGSGGYTYKYAALEDIVQAIAPIMHRHGLSYRFNTGYESTPPAQVVICTITHRDGHSESSEFRTPIDSGARMNVMQQSASAQTYGKRYALCNALGIVPSGEDDDSRSVGTRPPMPRPSVSPSAPVNSARPARNLVRIPPRKEQDSDGDTSGGGTTRTPPVAETPAPSETDSDASALRAHLINGMSRLLRARAAYRDWDDAKLLEKTGDVLDQWCRLGFSRPMSELTVPELRRAVDKLDQTIAERAGDAA
jgi:hypothetical protein